MPGPDHRPLCHGKQGEKNEFGGLKKTGKPSLIFRYVKNYMKGKKIKLTSPFKDEKYNLFVMERNEYIGSKTWPPKETMTIPYYLGPSGYLGEKKYRDNGNLEYEYRPSDPYPSIGGTILGEGVGPARQNGNTNRKDQLVFEMSITDKPLTLLGPVSATLWLSSDVPCTDFIRMPSGCIPRWKNNQHPGRRSKSKVQQYLSRKERYLCLGYGLSDQ